jgi:hypothetical protein
LPDPFQSTAGSSGEETRLGKLSLKEKAKMQGGNPDEWDFKNLQTIIDLYNKAFPGRLNSMKNGVLTENAIGGDNEYGELSKDSGFRKTMWMPADLQQVIEAGYPSIWTNQKHLTWFLKRFPIFKRSKKI